MNNIFRAGQATALLATMVLVAGDFAIPVSAIAQGIETNSQATENSTLIAQSLVGQCRAVNQDVFIYSERSTTSPQIRALPNNTQVTLAGESSAGWIAISAPATGFVQTSNLKSCPTPTNQGLVGQCRAVNQDVFIYSERSTNSTRIRALPNNTQVTLADNGSAGWIAVSAPATGFVQTNNLKPCSGTGTPPVSNLCRQLRVALNVRATPSATGNFVSTISAGQRVTLRSAEERVVAGRSWVEISSPSAGWISSGVGTNRNIENCPGTTPPVTSRACRVTAPIGLRTHQSAGGAAIAPGVGFNEMVTITGERRTIGNRVWLQISRPTNAWISSGFVGNESNLTPNPCR